MFAASGHEVQGSVVVSGVVVSGVSVVTIVSGVSGVSGAAVSVTASPSSALSAGGDESAGAVSAATSLAWLLALRFREAPAAGAPR